MLKVAAIQLNPLVGDIEGNADAIVEKARIARDDLSADIGVFPELVLCGYPPEDLLLRPDFMRRVDCAMERILKEIKGIAVVIGFPERADGALYNSAAVFLDGRCLLVYRKTVLPNYGVFDEKRYFSGGTTPGLFSLKGARVAVSICEDVWSPGVVERSCEAGAQILLNLNASPFHGSKIGERENVIRERIRSCRIPVVYVNQVGGQDELVFDGASFAMNAAGEVVFRAPEFAESTDIIEFSTGPVLVPAMQTPAPAYSPVSSDYKALVLGIRDYVSKNGFDGAVLGLSGGIDSAMTLALAVDALGAERVEAVMMPSRYTADMSNEDAVLQADALGVHYSIIPIEPAVAAFSSMLEQVLRGTEADTTEENIQARCRGVILMAISNKTRKLLLTTGNKSEMSVGYATLYGDMAGGFAPLKDVPKMLVYRMAEYRNTLARIIPLRVIERPPSAELRPDQVDQDSLPPYPVLDAILQLYVEQDRSREEIVAEGFDELEVARVLAMVDNNEYKRRQAPPGVRITRRAFGRDRRYPITSGFRAG